VILNLPNSITTIRIALVPVFIWLLVGYPTQLGRWLALAVFILAMATDGLDGSIARRRGLVTNLGKILDPIADKALIGGALITLSILGEVHWGFTVAILVREIGITVYRLSVLSNRVIAASGGGKFKTIFQSIVIGLLVSPLASYWKPLGPIGLWLLAIAAVITVVTGAQYLLATIRVKS
jgi:CDP-diacylglycerol--glycerol-3-phosphate 3-phosphatidyltransferase